MLSQQRDAGTCNNENGDLRRSLKKSSSNKEWEHTGDSKTKYFISIKFVVVVPTDDDKLRAGTVNNNEAWHEEFAEPHIW